MGIEEEGSGSKRERRVKEGVRGLRERGRGDGRKEKERRRVTSK